MIQKVHLKCALSNEYTQMYTILNYGECHVGGVCEFCHKGENEENKLFWYLVSKQQNKKLPSSEVKRAVETVKMAPYPLGHAVSDDDVSYNGPSCNALSLPF